MEFGEQQGDETPFGDASIGGKLLQQIGITSAIHVEREKPRAWKRGGE
ncbi:MAG: hypothetical protein RIA64_10545 [Rhodospirillales bacterium]